jgi:hypothetical protein
MLTTDADKEVHIERGSARRAAIVSGQRREHSPPEDDPRVLGAGTSEKDPSRHLEVPLGGGSTAGRGQVAQRWHFRSCVRSSRSTGRKADPDPSSLRRLREVDAVHHREFARRHRTWSGAHSTASTGVATASKIVGGIRPGFRSTSGLRPQARSASLMSPIAQ